MADFKIKPASGTGNKLILRSEDGTEVLLAVNDGVETSTTTKVKQKGAFMQSSTHQALTLGG